MKTLIIGARANGHAKVVLEILRAMGNEVVGFIDDNVSKKGNKIRGISILGAVSEIKAIAKKYKATGAIVAIGDNPMRRKLSSEIEKAGLKLVNAIHPTVHFDSDVKIGNGCYIGQGVIVVTGTKIGNCVNIHTGATIDHDNIIGDGANLGPGVHTAGRVKIGRDAFLGTGAIVIPDGVVEEGAIVGAGAVVIRTVKANTKVAGVPAKEIHSMKTIFITGGAGYVGAVLTPKLLSKGYKVTVLDLMIYGEEVLPTHPNLKVVKGDIRDQKLLKEILPGHDAVIHLACISNDPSFELNPRLGKSINLDAFEPLVKISKESGVKRFIYASSSSVYGIKDKPDVNEEMKLEPLTDYSKFKMQCEEILHEYQSENFTTLTIRPATVCGYSPRLRLDLTVNVLTNLAVNKGEITVFGGEQKRPNIHIEDITDLYILLLELPRGKISGKIWNAGYENHKVKEIAQMVKNVVGNKVNIITTATNDHRSYHISSEKIKKDIGFVPKHTIEDAVRDLKNAFEKGWIPNSFTDDKYFNVKRMQYIHLQ